MLCAKGYIPSYCTACYRQGRTGDRFMSLAKPGKIQDICRPNALLTFKEYLVDYASPSTRIRGEEIIRSQLELVETEEMRRETERRLALIEAGERDQYF